MRVKLDEENQKIIPCPNEITKTKPAMQSELQGDGSYIDVKKPLSYDITGYQNAQESLDDGYLDIDDDLIALFNQDKAIIKNNSIIDIQKTTEYKSKISAAEKSAQKFALQAEVDELDKKKNPCHL
jgi:hypothetical protein